MRAARRTVFPLLLFLAACQSDEAISFPQPRYGKDTCAECGSTIHDPNFAAVYRLPGGMQKLFDDPGCLFRSLRTEEVPPTIYFFHTYGGDRWFHDDEVFFAKTPTTKSPHGYDWAAYGSFGEAQTAVTSAGAGELLSFAQAKERLGADPP